MRDIQKDLKRRRHVRLAATMPKAEIVLRVVSREIVSGDPVAIATRTGTSTFVLPLSMNWCMVLAKMEIGTYEMPIAGVGEIWRGSAARIGHQLEAWVKTNYETPLARRSDGFKTPQ